MGCLEIVAIIVLLGILALLACSSIKYFKMDKASKRRYIKGFKKGKCLIVYIFLIPLYFAYYLKQYICDVNDQVSNILKGFRAFFKALTYSAGAITLKFEVLDLNDVGPYFSIALITTFVLCVLNAGLFIYSLLKEKIFRETGLFDLKHLKGERLIVIGNTDTSKNIYKSFKGKNKMLFDVYDNEMSSTLYISDIKNKNFRNYDVLSTTIRGIIESLKKHANGVSVDIIINTSSLDNNLSLSLNLTKIIEDNSFINIYTFGSKESERIYSEIERGSNGYFHYINEHRQVAIDFVDKYPLTKFMDSGFINYETATLKDDCKVNVFLLGYGKLNKEMLSTLISNSQFITLNEKKEPIAKNVNYYVFDRNLPSNEFKDQVTGEANIPISRYEDMFFNRNGTFKEEYANGSNSNYLPLPSLPYNKHMYRIDSETYNVVDKLKEIINNSKKDENTRVLNYIIISLGDEYINYSLSLKINTFVDSMNIKDTYVFSNIKNKWNLLDKIVNDNKNSYLFGNVDEVVYNYDKIKNGTYIKLGIVHHFLYELENKKITIEQATKSWHKDLRIFQRNSNIDSVLNLRLRYNLIGLDFTKDNIGDKLSNDDFLQKYAKGYPIKIDEETKQVIYDIVGDEKMYEQTGYNKTLRYYMSFIEHNRWNASMIINDWIPTMKENISKEGKGKSEIIRTHGCITTYEGLKEYREIVYNPKNKKINDLDVIKYDYQLLDKSYELLEEEGFIVYETKK